MTRDYISNKYDYMMHYHIAWRPAFDEALMTAQMIIDTENSIKSICERFKYRINALNLTPTQIHIFVSIPHTVAPIDVVRTLKSESAFMIIKTHPEVKAYYAKRGVLWSEEYFLSSAEMPDTNKQPRPSYTNF